MHTPQRHDSAHKHVSGTADYIDDLIEPAGTLHVSLGLATIAHGEILSMDLDSVRAVPGVVGVLTAADIPGARDISPSHKNDEPVFAVDLVAFHGQPLFAVVATTRDIARRAARLAKVSYRERPPILDVAAARAAGGALVTPGLTLERGDAETALAQAPRRLAGSMAIGGQEHFYLESHIALAIPGEDRDMTVYSSAQHPDEVQRMVARVLGVPAHAVNVIIRRMGGGFGGKESQSNLFACVAAIASRAFGRAVKLRPDRDDDMTMTGKRHDFVVDYQVGFDDEGRIEGVDAVFAARCGHSADLSRGVTDRTLTHADNAYFFPAVRLRSLPLRTNTVSNTAFRGYGGPQGMLACERWIAEIAYALGKDPLEIRKANFYGETDRNVTPYHQTIGDNILARLVGELEASADYSRRRAEILAHNRGSAIRKRGIALTPVKFGISFTMLALNQAGALIHVYRDGSVQLNHGGTEMGQGLHTKIAQVVAQTLQIDIAQVKVMATATDKVPNASSTAASSGSDLNGMAAAHAAEQIRDRLIEFVVGKYGVERQAVRFEANAVLVGDLRIGWPELAEQAYLARIPLSASGFYSTPGIHWNRDAGRGNPYLYYTYGASCSEVTVDTLTGEYSVDRVDILHDVGRSLNPAIDIGQIEGGFVQGMGWLTTEELWWDGKGRLRTHAPSTYKIPVASDIPKIFNVKLADWSVNRATTIGRSKAVGEPPFMLALSVFEALGMAAASVADYRIAPRMDAPATPERVLMTIERLKREAGATPASP
ncbi:xanthine dehydrogenase molybdopterin binding subunit [Kaistia sp. UC242_56]|uniref:xanthine dehydrogenase molybdopterin binding subunit n=1 Tax=Kaistia sp. UC242_56 TaxID=3374625 RepID=UPI0037B0FB6F